MFDKISNPTLCVLLIAAIAVVCACQPEDVAQPMTLNAAVPLPSPELSTFVGTLPISRVDELAITPTESAGAASTE